MGERPKGEGSQPTDRRTLLLSRRAFLRLTGALTIGIFAGYINRYTLRQWIKEFLSGYPELFHLAAVAEEYGLRLLGMEPEVTLYRNFEENAPIGHPDEASINRIQRNQDAVDFFQEFPRVPLLASEFHSPATNVAYTAYHFDEKIRNNSHIRAVLGMDISTPSHEMLPWGAVALKCVMPQGVRSAIAPAVPVPNHFDTNEATMVYKGGDYRALALPDYLLSQTVLSLGHRGPDRQVVPDAERMILGGVDMKGASFASGDIRDGAAYLWANGSSWGVVQWPSPELLADNTSCARLFWNMNPIDPDTGMRQFTPYENNLFAEQAAQQFGYLNHLVTGTEYQQIGPSVVFRTDAKQHLSDVIMIPPFLPLVAPSVLKDILMDTPIGLSTTVSDPQDMNIGMSDVKYNTMYGFHPGFLFQEGHADFSSFDTKAFGWEEKQHDTTDFLSMNNSLALYLGYN